MTARLPAAAWLTAPATRAVLAALDATAPGASRFVGGCVRNTLLGQPIDDIDIATQLTPEEVAAAAQAARLEAIPTGAAHGTMTVVAEHQPFEVTTLRRDVSTDGRRATVAFTKSWEEDARRRDFHINALYAEANGVLHDPTGSGLADAQQGRVRFIGDPFDRIAEDYLRILRFFRFFAWYGRADPDPDGLAACAAMRDGLAQLSVERVWKEIKKLLAAADPRAAVIAMETSGVLARVLPEGVGLSRLERLVAIETSVLGQGDPMARVAALMPDDPELARAVAQRLKLSNDERGRLVRALDPGQRVVADMSPRQVRRALYAMGAQAFADRVKLAWAAAGPDSATEQWRALLATAEAWVRPRLALTGDDIIAAGVPEGPRVGAVMREVEAWWIEADFTDDKLSIVERLRAVARGSL
jgi:poly(A) polymerase